MSQQIELYRKLNFHKLGSPTVMSSITCEDDGTIVALGSSSDEMTLTAGTPLFSMYSTCSSTTSTNAEPFYVKTTMTGAGGYGGRARFHTHVDARLITNVMPLKSLLEFDTAGNIAGLAAGFCSEVDFSAGTTGGSFTGIENELVFGSGATCPNLHTSFFYCNASGDGVATFNTNGVLFDVEGLTGATTKILYNNTLRCLVGGTTWYLPMSSAEGSYTTAYPIALTTTGTTALTITPTISGATVSNFGLYMPITDTAAQASGNWRAIYVNWTSSGAKTGGSSRGLAIDWTSTDTLTNGATLYPIWINMTLSGGNQASGVVCAMGCNVGAMASTGTSSIYCLDLSRTITTYQGTVRDAFARIRNYGATAAKTVFLIEAAGGTGAATNMFTFWNSEPPYQATTLSGSITGRIKIALQSAGGSEVAGYIPVYTS